MRFARFAMAACALALSSLPASAAGVDKLYVLYCGEASATDQSRWSPGVNVGVPIELSDNCYSFITRRAGSCGVSATGITGLYDPSICLTHISDYPPPEPMEFSSP